MPNQNQRVFSTLKHNKGKWVDAMVFINQYPCILRYNSRINDLRNQGHDIKTEIKKGARTAMYMLVKEAK